MRDERKTPAKLKKFIKREGKTKLKPLRKTVLHPLLITVTALSIIMLIFFNIVISIMLYSGVYGLKNKYLGIFGTMMWSGGGVRGIKAFADSLKGIEVIGEVESKGTPKEDIIVKLEEIAKVMAEKLISER